MIAAQLPTKDEWAKRQHREGEVGYVKDATIFRTDLVFVREVMWRDGLVVSTGEVVLIPPNECVNDLVQL